MFDQLDSQATPQAPNAQPQARSGVQGRSPTRRVFEDPSMIWTILGPKVYPIFSGVFAKSTPSCVGAGRPLTVPALPKYDVSVAVLSQATNGRGLEGHW